MEQAHIETIVRSTVRISGLMFVAALTLYAAAGARRRWIRHAVRALAAFIAAHTIHFGAVVWLAVVTAGTNIDERGGWGLMLLVAVLFYSSAFGVLGTWREVAAGRQPTAPSVAAARFGVLFIAAIFLNSYFARVEGMPIYWLAATAMIAAVGLYFLRDTRHRLVRLKPDATT
jgi:hypothetical protein